MAYKFLVVDDSAPMRSVIIKTIKAAGFGSVTFLQAENGQQAIEILKSETVHLVLTDYNMPVVNGLELVEMIKKDENLKNIPVIAVTTDGNPRRIIEFIEKGAADYIKKPFTPEIICSKIKRIIGEPDGNSLDSYECDEGIDF